MAVLTAYENNPALRNKYYELNGIKHAEVWRDAPKQYCLMLCRSTGCGVIELECPTKREAVEYAKRYAPELKVEFYSY